MTPFSQRAESMGLESVPEKGLFYYVDRYGEVVYRQLSPISIPPTEHPTDNLVAPLLGIYTKPAEGEYRYCGYVSDSYRFIGNDALIERIRSAISSIGTPILEETALQNFELTRLRNEMIISSSKSIQEVGDVLPVMIVDNSYNGTKAATLSFGIATKQGEEYIVFGFKLGELRQVHIERQSTSLTSAISSYMEVFNDGITEMITGSFSNRINEEDLLRVLDVVESYGKRRREKISELLTEQIGEHREGQPPPLPTSWQLFLSIVRYSSFEPNLNIKRLLENAAESVLVIPQRMRNVLDSLSR